MTIENLEVLDACFFLVSRPLSSAHLRPGAFGLAAGRSKHLDHSADITYVCTLRGGA